MVAANLLPWVAEAATEADLVVCSLFTSCCFVQEKHSKATTLKIRFLIVQIVSYKIMEVFSLYNELCSISIEILIAGNAYIYLMDLKMNSFLVAQISEICNL